MQVFAGTDPRTSVGEVSEFAARVERLGFDGLHVAEMIHDPFVVSALALEATTGLKVRTAVALAFVRSPMATALSAWGLAQQSGGRFDLGLGTQVHANIEERYGAEFDRPVARMADYIGAVRACFAAFAGERLGYQGEFYRLTRLQPDFRPDPLPDVPPPEIWLGAVGDQMLGLAGRLATGVITHPTNSHPIDLTQRTLPLLTEAAAAAERSRPLLVVGPLVATGPDEAAIVVERDRIRRRLAFLYSTPAYRPTLELLGLGGLGEQLRDLVRDEGWDRLALLLTDDILDEVVPTGTWEELPVLLADWYGELADGILLRPPGGTGTDDRFAEAVANIRSEESRR